MSFVPQPSVISLGNAFNHIDSAESIWGRIYVGFIEQLKLDMVWTFKKINSSLFGLWLHNTKNKTMLPICYVYPEQPGATQFIIMSSGQCKLTALIVICMHLLTWEMSVKIEVTDYNQLTLWQPLFQYLNFRSIQCPNLISNKKNCIIFFLTRSSTL